MTISQVCAEDGAVSLMVMIIFQCSDAVLGGVHLKHLIVSFKMPFVLTETIRWLELRHAGDGAVSSGGDKKSGRQMPS